MTASDKELFEFDSFRFDPAQHLLLHDGELVPLEPKVFETLLVLIRNGGRLVGKDELMKEVWPDSFVEESNLARNISVLRKALYRSDGGPQYIETVPKRGYRFVGELRALAGEQAELILQTAKVSVLVEEEESDGETDQEGDGATRRLGEFATEHQITRYKLKAATVVAVLIAAAAASYYYFSAPNSKSINSVAVLPFVNASGNADVEYLSDGMSESLINSLSQLPNLSVKARSSVFRYKGKDVEPQQVAAELSVQAVLNGRFVLRGDDLALYLSLIDARTGNQIWGEQYNRKLAGLVALQSEITRDVSRKLRARLSGADEQRVAKNYTENVEAYQLYLKGNYEWNKHTEEDLQKGIEYYNQALEKDPNYALAYTGLAASYSVLGNNYLPPSEAFPKAKAYSAKALAIDEALGEAHSTMAAVNLFYDWNWAEAEREMKRALVLDPNNSGTHDIYSLYFWVMGRPDEAQAETKRAQELDPLSLMFSTNIGNDFYYARQYDEAIAQLEKTINLDPRYNPAYLWLGQAFEQKKMYAEAITTFQKGMSQGERHPKLLALLGHAYALSGERNKANKVLAELREVSKQRYVSPYLIAVVYVGLGDKQQAFAWLDRACKDRSFLLLLLKVEPIFDSLRDDPRFTDLLRRIGISP